MATAAEPPASAWDLGDYSRVARRLEPAAESIVAAAGPGRGRFALDIAAGDGSGALRLAREGWTTSATDSSARMVRLGAARAAESDLSVRWDRADLLAQPYEDSSMDLVTSSFGMIFAEASSAVVAEVARVLNPAGRLLLTAWTDDGYMAEMTDVMMAFFPEHPPQAPMRWGAIDFVHDQLSCGFLDVHVERRSLPWSFASAHAARLFLESFSPPHVAGGRALDDGGVAMMDAVEQHLHSLAEFDGTVDLEATYLLVDAHRLP